MIFDLVVQPRQLNFELNQSPLKWFQRLEAWVFIRVNGWLASNPNIVVKLNY